MAETNQQSARRRTCAGWRKLASPALRTAVLAMVFWAGACASLLPPPRSAFVGGFSVNLAFNLYETLYFNNDGSYRRLVTFAFCVPFVVIEADGTKVEERGWTNEEDGDWRVVGRSIVLTKRTRTMENPAEEAEYFDAVRSLPISFDGKDWTLHYPDRTNQAMKKVPDPSPYAMVRPR